MGYEKVKRTHGRTHGVFVVVKMDEYEFEVGIGSDECGGLCLFLCEDFMSIKKFFGVLQ